MAVVLAMGALPAAALGIWTTARRSQPAAPPADVRASTASSSAGLRDLDAELRRQRQALEALERRARRLEQGPGTKAAPPPHDPTQLGEDTAPASPPSFEEALFEAKTRQAQLNDAFGHEGTDARWAGATETAARSAASELGLSVSSVKCRTTFCQLRFQSDDRASRLEQLSAKPPFSFGGYAYMDPETQEAVLYFAREGQRLPDDRAAAGAL
ncbi:MAG: hypothetical protein KC776_17135 [Myxococcales bacterium]|nr:hypothetical protein [Myxococcales bacterium]MCB9583718.1 hypothetical protein [Polyangiaceae bacterium]